jgi:hypothetical protein
MNSGTQYRFRSDPTKICIVSPILLLAFSAAAHAPVPSRTLRLQLQGGQLEGLLTLHLPAAAARAYGAATDPAVALVPLALAGLRIEADGKPLRPKVSDARARALPGGALDELILLEVGAARSALRIAVEAEPPLPIDLLAATGTRLTLTSGPGAPMHGGLSLRPRPGLPCEVTITSSASPKTPR